MTKLKVLLVAPFPPPYGGIAKYVQDIWNSPDLNNAFKFYRLNTARGEGLMSGAGRGENTWARWKLFLVPRNWGFLFFALIGLGEFVLKCLWIQPDVIHVHTCSYFGFIRSGIFLFLARLFRARRILHLHNSIDDFFESNRQRPFWLNLMKWSLAQAGELVVLSDGLQKWVKQNLNQDAKVIWNACDIERYKNRDRVALDRLFPQARDRVVILMIGGLHEYKGAFDLLSAVTRLNSVDKARLSFFLPGGGDRDRAKAWISDNSLEQCVFLPGVVSEETKTTLYGGADIFVLPSYTEGQPIAILEAMAAALPVISTRIGSIPEIIEHGVNGFLLKPGDIEKIGDYLISLADYPELRRKIGRQNREKVERAHSLTRLVAALNDLYALPDPGQRQFTGMHLNAE